MSIQTQHCTILEGCSSAHFAHSTHTCDQKCVARPLSFLELLVQVLHTLVPFLHFPEGRTVFVEGAWDFQSLQNKR